MMMEAGSSHAACFQKKECRKCAAQAHSDIL